MKKLRLFMISTSLAVGIAYISKQNIEFPKISHAPKKIWKTFEKTANKKLSIKESTIAELEQAKIPKIKRAIAQENSSEEKTKEILKDTRYKAREGRILIGDQSANQYADESVDLVMINQINPKWEEILGLDLLRFHHDDTKVMMKPELSLIRIQNGKGQYVEQVIITYLFSNGETSSFRALIDSSNGYMMETWDRTIHERIHQEQAGFPLPKENKSGIKTR